MEQPYTQKEQEKKQEEEVQQESRTANVHFVESALQDAILSGCNGAKGDTLECIVTMKPVLVIVLGLTRIRTLTSSPMAAAVVAEASTAEIQ